MTAVPQQDPPAGPHDDGGAVGILTAASLAMLCAFGAIAADASYLYFGKRDLQAAVDAAALSAARAPADATRIANDTLARQNIPAAATRSVTPGIYDERAAAGARFAAAGTGANAVRVEAQRVVPLGLGRLFVAAGTATIAAQATAAHVPAGAFMLSSTTASLNGGLLNTVLSGLLGSSLSLDLASYQGLAGTRVSLLRTLDNLATELNLQAGDYAGLLRARAQVGQVLSAAANALDPGGATPAARAALLQVAGRVNPQLALTVGELIDLGLMQGESVGAGANPNGYAKLSANALELLQAAARLGGAGRVVDLGTALTLPGATVGVKLMAIEPPVTAPPPPAEGMMVLGPVGTTARTAQLRLALDVKLGSLTLPLIGTLANVVHIPIQVQVAAATARLADVSCPGNLPGSDDTTMTIQARTGVVTAQIGEVTNTGFSNAALAPAVSPATILDTSKPLQATVSEPNPLGALLSPVLSLVNTVVTVKVVASTKVPVQLAEGSQTMVFSPAQIAAHAPASVSSTGSLAGLSRSLGGGNLQLDAQIKGLLGNLQLSAGDVTGAVLSALTPVLGALDPLLDGLLATLGLRLGIAEVTPGGARCGVPVLVI